MSCAFCGMPPRDGEPCCTGRFKVETMRRADRTIATQKLELARTAALLAECEEALEWYGEHDQTCGFGQMREDAAGCSIPPLCDCGFEAILSKIRSAKEKA